MVQTKEAIKIIESVIKALPEDDTSREQYERFLKGAKNASGMINGHKEKELRLQMDTTNAASHAIFTLFRKNLLTKELEAEWRALKTPEETTAEYDAVYKERNEADDKLRKEVQKAQDAQKDMDIFVQVIGGASAKEAERRIESYRQAGGK